MFSKEVILYGNFRNKRFENKYGINLLEFKKEYESGLENFEKYDDLVAWEFAQQEKDYWNKKLEELKSVL